MNLLDVVVVVVVYLGVGSWRQGGGAPRIFIHGTDKEEGGELGVFFCFFFFLVYATNRAL